MLSGKLVHLIESHWEEIISSVIARIRREPQMAHYRARVWNPNCAIGGRLCSRTWANG